MYTEQDYKNDNNINYSVFDPSKSYYSEGGDMDKLNTSKRYETEKISTKNKLAFFRTQGILVKNSEI